MEGGVTRGTRRSSIFTVSILSVSQAPPHSISKLILEQWKALSPEHSRAYSVLSATFAESKKSQLVSPQRRKRVRGDKDPKAPKAATSAYMYFSKHHRNVLKRENSELSFGDLGKTVGAMWKAAPPEERRPFEEQAALDKDRYMKQATVYKGQVSASGGDEEKSDSSKKVKLPSDNDEGNDFLLASDDLEDDAAHVLLSDDDAGDDDGDEDEDEDEENGDDGGNANNDNETGISGLESAEGERQLNEGGVSEVG